MQHDDDTQEDTEPSSTDPTTSQRLASKLRCLADELERAGRQLAADDLDVDVHEGRATIVAGYDLSEDYDLEADPEDLTEPETMTDGSGHDHTADQSCCICGQDKPTNSIDPGPVGQGLLSAPVDLCAFCQTLVGAPLFGGCLLCGDEETAYYVEIEGQTGEKSLDAHYSGGVCEDCSSHLIRELQFRAIDDDLLEDAHDELDESEVRADGGVPRDLPSHTVEIDLVATRDGDDVKTAWTAELVVEDGENPTPARATTPTEAVDILLSAEGIGPDADGGDVQ